MMRNEMTIGEQQTMNDAVILATSADAATILHAVAAPVIAAHIISHEQPSFREMAMHCVASSMDYVDGKLKSRAVALATSVLFPTTRDLRDPNNRPSAEEWQKLNKIGIHDRPRFDDLTDKGYFYTVMGALLQRALSEGHSFTAAGISANLAVSVTRDGIKEIDRNNANKNGLSVHSVSLGKEKTKWHKAGMCVLTSPLARLSVGRLVGVSIISYGTRFGIRDAISYHRYVRHEKARHGL